jgi:hypothetical protein
VIKDIEEFGRDFAPKRSWKVVCFPRRVEVSQTKSADRMSGTVATVAAEQRVRKIRCGCVGIQRLDRLRMGVYE